MGFNICSTCGAKDGRAGLLIDGECQNCHKTRQTGELSIHAELVRTNEEIARTFAILEERTSHEYNDRNEEAANPVEGSSR